MKTPGVYRHGMTIARVIPLGLFLSTTCTCEQRHHIASRLPAASPLRNMSTNLERFKAFTLPIRRRTYIRDKENRAIPEKLMVSIDMSEVAFL